MFGSIGSVSGGVGTLQQVLTAGDTASIPAIFSAGGETTIISPSGINIDSTGASLYIADSVSGVIMARVNNADGSFSFGDISGTLNTPAIFATTTEITVQAAGGLQYFHADPGTKIVELQSAEALGIIQLLTTSPGVSLILNNGTSTITADTNGGVFSINGKASINLADVPDYADNAAALLGLLSVGRIYRTSTLGTSTLKIVQ